MPCQYQSDNTENGLDITVSEDALGFYKERSIGTGIHRKRQEQNCFMFHCREQQRKKTAFINGIPSIDSDSSSTCCNSENNSPAPEYDVGLKQCTRLCLGRMKNMSFSFSLVASKKTTTTTTFIQLNVLTKKMRRRASMMRIQAREMF